MSRAETLKYASALEAVGYDGLYLPHECACKTDDLEPCEFGASPECLPGYVCECDCGDHDYHIGAE
jgi:hypothetical protein